MNVEQMLDRFFRLTQSKQPDRYYAIDLFNDALTQLSDEARYQDKVEITVTTGVARYPLPDLYKAPVALIEGDPSCPSWIYPRLQISEQGWGYSVFGGELLLKPEPGEDRTLQFYYYRYVQTLVDETDVPEIDAQWHYLLPTYAASIVMGEFDKGLADRYFGQWESGLASFKVSMSRKNKAQRANQTAVW